MTKIDTEKKIKALFELGAHLGHKKNRIHPKARRYIHSMVNGTSIIDLEQTVDQLQKAKDFLKEQIKSGKRILIVVTKKIANQSTRALCQKLDLPYITVKWPPGLLTNFDNIIKNVKKMKALEEGKSTGQWAKFVKHEQFKLAKNLTRLNTLYGGLIQLERRPDILVLVDTKTEKNALKEAREMKIPVVAILDTNSDPETTQYPIVANDDSATSVDYLVKDLLSVFTKK